MADPRRRTATSEDIAFVEAKRQQCCEQFTVESLASSMSKFYNLMITIGAWPLSSIHQPPHLNPTIDTAHAQSLGYSTSAINVMQSLPWPSDDIIHNRERRIFQDTRILNLTDPEDLQESRYPEGPSGPDGDELPIDGHLITLMIPMGFYGSTVLLDSDIGAIYQIITLDAPRCDTLEYCVGRTTCNVPEDKDWERYNPGPLKYRFSPFVPAAQWFDELYQKYLTLRRLPFLEPVPDGDRDIDLARACPDDDPLREHIKHQQDALVELYAKHGWPDFEAWDREGFMAEWEVVERRLRLDWRNQREQMEGRYYGEELE